MQEVTDPARRAVNPSPKWAVPIELIEWQASYTQEVRLLPPGPSHGLCPDPAQTLGFRV